MSGLNELIAESLNLANSYLSFKLDDFNALAVKLRGGTKYYQQDENKERRYILSLSNTIQSCIDYVGINKSILQKNDIVSYTVYSDIVESIFSLRYQEKKSPQNASERLNFTYGLMAQCRKLILKIKNFDKECESFDPDKAILDDRNEITLSAIKSETKSESNANIRRSHAREFHHLNIAIIISLIVTFVLYVLSYGIIAAIRLTPKELTDFKDTVYFHELLMIFISRHSLVFYGILAFLIITYLVYCIVKNALYRRYIGKKDDDGDGYYSYELAYYQHDILIGHMPSVEAYEIQLLEAASKGRKEAYYSLGRIAEKKRDYKLAMSYYLKVGNDKKAIKRINKIRRSGNE